MKSWYTYGLSIGRGHQARLVLFRSGKGRSLSLWIPWLEIIKLGLYRSVPEGYELGLMDTVVRDYQTRLASRLNIIKPGS